MLKILGHPAKRLVECSRIAGEENGTAGDELGTGAGCMDDGRNPNHDTVNSLQHYKRFPFGKFLHNNDKLPLGHQESIMTQVPRIDHAVAAEVIPANEISDERTHHISITMLERRIIVIDSRQCLSHQS